MSELALYRKYRSQSFDEVVGQPHVVATLVNALKSGRVSHAYLLTGPRGVGKTSVARLLARAVNCLAEGSKPCNTCEICLVPLASNMDIIEIDAASNRRIDEMRDLRDKINLAPTRSHYKVYIIDEVHMLTTEAFNALLKTLEEPPSHAIFVLATTEVHKLPETIISRTQRFNFKAIGMPDIEEHLAGIAAKEGINIEPEAIHLIAEASRGGFRDAISLLDQVANTAQQPITAASLEAVMGLGSAEAVEQLIRAIVGHKPGEALSVIDQMTAQGVQTGQLVMQLINRLRRLMLDGINHQKSDGPDISEHLAARIINRLAQVLPSPLPAIALETAIVEMTVPRPTAPAEALPAVPRAEKPQLAVAATEESPLQAAPKPPTEPQTQAGDAWPKALILIKAKNNSLYALLCSCRAEVGQDSVTINCRFNFHRERLNEPKNREIIEAALAKVYGKTMLVSAQLEKSTGPAADPSAELVSSALEILGGEIVSE